jgi:hypothetical protein
MDVLDRLYVFPHCPRGVIEEAALPKLSRFPTAALIETVELTFTALRIREMVKDRCALLAA